MDEMRDRLIELFDRYYEDENLAGAVCYFTENESKALANYLLANGAILPPVKLGQTVYYITGIHGKIIKPAKVEEIYYGESGFAFHVCHDYTYFDLQQEEAFLTREDAEKTLKERENK